jgi:hypothetical protein
MTVVGRSKVLSNHPSISLQNQRKKLANLLVRNLEDLASCANSVYAYSGLLHGLFFSSAQAFCA